MINQPTLTACAALMLATATNVQAAKPVSGAIFTTDRNGTLVNGAAGRYVDDHVEQR